MILGGLYIPDNAKERPTEGIVMAAGPGRVHPETGLQLECAVSAGESVIYGKYDGTEMKYNEANHQLIKDDDVLLKYTGNDLTFLNCEPVKDQVMIRLAGKESASAAGIILNSSDSKEKRIDCGIVAKIGPGRQAGNGAVMPIQVLMIEVVVSSFIANNLSFRILYQFIFLYFSSMVASHFQTFPQKMFSINNTRSAYDSLFCHQKSLFVTISFISLSSSSLI